MYDLGLASDAVWGLTMRQFEALLERRTEDRKSQDRRAGEITAMLYNAHRDVEKDPRGATWWDFFPEWADPDEPQTDEQMLNAMILWSQMPARQRA